MNRGRVSEVTEEAAVALAKAHKLAPKALLGCLESARAQVAEAGEGSGVAPRSGALERGVPAFRAIILWKVSRAVLPHRTQHTRRAPPSAPVGERAVGERATPPS